MQNMRSILALKSNTLLMTQPIRLFSFNRLTAHYPQRKAMRLVIEDLQKRERHRALPFLQKFRFFFTLKKRRFFYMFLIYMAYKYYTRVSTWAKNKKQRTINKYKRRWVNRFNPEAITYQTAIDASYYQPVKLSSEGARRLGEAFSRVDRKLKFGFSRQLIINILNRMEVIDDKEQKKFLSDSGYRTIRKKMLCSCTLRQFFELVESKIKENETEFVDKFLTLLEDELKDFEERTEKMIKLLETQAFDRIHDAELNKEEKKKFDEEQAAIKAAERNKQ